jgi:two-component system sensor histidine kinase UhpB
LHDETGQLLTGVSLRLKALTSRVEPQAAQELSELQEHVKSAQDSMRQILRRLRPIDLGRGLGQAIRELAQRTRDTCACEVRVELEPLPPIAEEVELVLFRVCQEGLTNVARHSGASHAMVALTAFDQRVRLMIEDDGVGFDVEAPTGRLGLSGVAERVELVGGTLRITSSPGAGTAIVVDVAAASAPAEDDRS